MFSRSNRERLLIAGYARSSMKHDPPSDIVNLCFLCFHHADRACFERGSKGIALNEDVNIMTQTKGSCGSCYGDFAMPSLAQMDAEYRFTLKVIKVSDGGLCIGIDDADGEHTEDDFAGNDMTKHYAYFSQDGTLFECGSGIGFNAGKQYGSSYGNDDEIEMIYNPYRGTLQFILNGKDQGVIENVYKAKGLQYRLCVATYGTTCSVKLIECV